MESVRARLGDDGDFASFRAELKPLLMRMSVCASASANHQPQGDGGGGGHGGGHGGGGAHAHGGRTGGGGGDAAELRAAVESVHALLLRSGLGPLRGVFADYVPQGAGRDHWRALMAGGAPPAGPAGGSSACGCSGGAEEEEERPSKSHRLAYEA